MGDGNDKFLRIVMLLATHHVNMTESTAIRIATRDRMLALDLLDPDEKRVEKGMSNTIDGNTKITYQGTKIQKGVGGPEISEWVLQFGTSVSAGLLGNWIYDQLTKRGVQSDTTYRLARCRALLKPTTCDRLDDNRSVQALFLVDDKRHTWRFAAEPASHFSGCAYSTCFGWKSVSR